jgi:hypothetical protein
LEFLIFENGLSSNQNVDAACQAGYFLEEEDFRLNNELKIKHMETELENKIQGLDEKVCSKTCYQYFLYIHPEVQ